MASAHNSAAAALAIDGLSFQYSADSPLVVNALTARIEPGERVALWGESGSGKSTVMALIAGLAAPSAGSIHIDGLPMDAVHADSLRSSMAWVAQKPHVLAASLMDNIRLGRDIDDAALEQAVQSAALGPVLALRGNTVVGDGGLGLSGARPCG